MTPNTFFCALVTLTASLMGMQTSVANPDVSAPRVTLQAFKSEQELADLLRRWADEHRRRVEEQNRRRNETRMQAGHALGQLSAAAPGYAVASADGAASESVTNMQHAGVDEGGIVKLHGEHLVVLRRGRLFTINVRDKNLRPVSTVDAYGDGINPQGAWYDEMLLSGNTIIVIGYSYQRGGIEVGFFDMARAARSNTARPITYV